MISTAARAVARSVCLLVQQQRITHRSTVIPSQRMPAVRGISSSAASMQQATGDVIGIDLGTTNSCVAIMEVCVQWLRCAA